MARRPSGTGAPTRSRKSITHVVAYARKASADGAPDAPDDQVEDATGETRPVLEAAAPVPGEKIDPGSETAAKKGEPKVEKAKPETDEPATVDRPEPAKVEKEAPKPVTPPPPVAAVAPAAETLGPIYEPLLKPKDIPVEDPESPAPPPGVVPRGDSRSLRRRVDSIEEFVLIYRSQTFVISRSGNVGKRGRWKVVEYPTMGHASHAYAQECSRLVAQGFVDHRE
jgi:hypothetical protein